MKTNKLGIAVVAVTVFQTENLRLNALKMHCWNIVTTITVIQTEKAAIYGEMTAFLHKITPWINFCDASLSATNGCRKRKNLKLHKNKKSEIYTHDFSKICGKIDVDPHFKFY